MNLAEIQRWVSAESTGATSMFVGTARSHSQHNTLVTALEYDAYEEGFQGVVEQLVSEVRIKFADLERICVVHRTGKLEVGDIAVVVAASSAHRGDVFAAVEYLIAEVKHQAPIWKKEHGNRTTEWLGPC